MKPITDLVTTYPYTPKEPTLSAGGSGTASYVRTLFLNSNYTRPVIEGDEVGWPWPQVYLMLAPFALHYRCNSRHWDSSVGKELLVSR